MKKFAWAALALALCLCLAAPCAMAAEKVNVTLFSQDSDNYSSSLSVQSATAVGDTVYILTYEGLYRWLPGMAEPEQMSDQIFGDAYSEVPEGKYGMTELFAVEGVPYGVNRGTGEVWKLVDEAGAFAPQKTVTLENDFMRYKGDGYRDYGSFSCFAYLDGVLYITGNVSNADVSETQLMRFDFATGKVLKHEAAEDMTSLCAYKDGKLLAICYNENGPYNEQTYEANPNQLYLLDPATDAKTPLATLLDMSDASLCYDAAKDVVYFTSGASVYALDGAMGEPRLSAYMPGRIWGGDSSFGLLESGMFMTASYNGVTIRGLDLPSLAEGAVVVYGEYGSSQHMAVVNAHPDVVFTSASKWLNGIEALTNAMVSGDNTVDVMKLDSQSTPVQRMIKKGYAMALNDFPAIMETVARMDPKLLAPYTVDGKLYAVPVSVRGNAFSYDTEVWKELGLTEADVPTSYPELMDFVANFYYDYGEDHPEISLFDDVGYRSNLLQRYIFFYVDALTARGEALSFDTPAFRDYLKQLESVDFSELDPYEIMGDKFWEDESSQNEFWQKKSVFHMYYDTTSPAAFDPDSSTQIMPLSLVTGEDPFVPAESAVLIINPRTTRVANAALYVAEYLKNVDKQSDAYTLFPDNNEPLVNATYETDKADMEEYLAKQEEALKTAPEENKALLQDDIDYVKKELEGYERYRYRVTAEQIAIYRQKITPYLYPSQQNPITESTANGTSEFYKLISQYSGKAIDLEQFVREMDSRIRMMTLEDM